MAASFAAVSDITGKSITKASRTRIRAGRLALGLCAAMALGPLAADAAAIDTYYEHTLMKAADARCHMFSLDLASAIGVGQALARTAALRAGVDEDQLAAKAARAIARADIEPCDSKDLATVAGRERTAFQSYEHLQSIPYNGDFQNWWAVRQASNSGRVWNLSQRATFGRDSLTFGLTSTHDVFELMAVVRFADGATPYAAQLVMRDRLKSTRPFLDQRAADTKGIIPLVARVTPRTSTISYLADAKGEPDRLVRPAGKGSAIAYRFPAAAANAMILLDPREAVQIDFLFPGAGRDQVRTAYIEVGDFAAGKAFLIVDHR